MAKPDSNILFTFNGSLKAADATLNSTLFKPIYSTLNFVAIEILINLGVFVGGSSPTITFTHQAIDPYGNLLSNYVSTALAGNGFTSTVIGLGAGNQPLGVSGRFDWAFAGAPTSIPAALTVIGR